MIQLPESPRILLVRTDKIGDLILTTPALESLKKRFPKSFMAFLCSSMAAPVLENNPAIQEVIQCDEPGDSFSALISRLREKRFDIAIHFYVEYRSAMATFLSGIPLRLGPFSKPASLLFSHKVPQNRSRAEKHEAEYNLDLVKLCGADGIRSRPIIYLTESERKKGREILASIGVSQEPPPVMIHPGSAGSVQNWPLSHFLELAQKIADGPWPVVLTAGKGEERVLDEAKKLASHSLNKIHSIPAGSLTLRELASVISAGRIMISNSTGPLHMAVALGRPTLSFYPHFPKVTSAKRWGPFADPDSLTVLSPEKEDLPMASISPDRAFLAFKEIAGT